MVVNWNKVVQSPAALMQAFRDPGGEMIMDAAADSVLNPAAVGVESRALSRCEVGAMNRTSAVLQERDLSSRDAG